MESRPLYRVGAAGLDPRDGRLIEIVFKHSQYNKFEFRLVSDLSPDAVDIMIVNTSDPQGVKTAAAIRSVNRAVPIVAAVPRGAPSAARHAISIDRLTLQLLPILNRVVELELLGAGNTGVGHGFLPTAIMPGAEQAADSSVPEAQAPATAVPAESAPAAAAAMPAAQPAPVAGPVAPAPAATTVPVVRMAFDAVPAAPVAGATALGPGAAAVAAARAAAAAATGAAEPTRAMPPAPPPAAPQAAPAQPVPAQAAAERPPAPSNLVAFPLGNQVEPPRQSRLRVLVTDDSPTVRQQLSMAFERMGMVCETAASAELALERLAEQHFDLALVDVIMPDMDGYRLTREIKRNRRLRQMPVIILTSKSSPFDYARGALAGCDSFLTKPVPLKALETAVLKHLRKSLAIDDLSSLMRPIVLPAAAVSSSRPGSAAPAAPGRAAGKT